VQESCTAHECALPQPQVQAYSWTDPKTGATVPVEPWFCSSELHGFPYTARVATNTGLPPGKLEDSYAGWTSS
jgi:hypothetical protein